MAVLGRVGLFWIGYLIVLRVTAFGKGLVPPRLSDLTWGMLASAALVAMTRWMSRREVPATQPARESVRGAQVVAHASRFAVGALIGLTVYGITLVSISGIAGAITVSAATPPAVGNVLIVLLGFVALAAMEELGFRGYPLRALTAWAGAWPAQLIVAIAFGLSHLLYGWSLDRILWGVIPSAVLFGTAALVSGGLAMPIGVHAAVNAAQWLVGEKDAPGFWILHVAPEAAARVASLAPPIGACVPLATSALLWWWHTNTLRTLPRVRNQLPPVSST